MATTIQARNLMIGTRTLHGTLRVFEMDGTRMKLTFVSDGGLKTVLRPYPWEEIEVDE